MASIVTKQKKEMKHYSSKLFKLLIIVFRSSNQQETSAHQFKHPVLLAYSLCTKERRHENCFYHEPTTIPTSLFKPCEHHVSC